MFSQLPFSHTEVGKFGVLPWLNGLYEESVINILRTIYNWEASWH